MLIASLLLFPTSPHPLQPFVEYYSIIGHAELFYYFSSQPPPTSPMVGVGPCERARLSSGEVEISAKVFFYLLTMRSARIHVCIERMDRVHVSQRLMASWMHVPSIELSLHGQQWTVAVRLINNKVRSNGSLSVSSPSKGQLNLDPSPAQLRSVQRMCIEVTLGSKVRHLARVTQEQPLWMLAGLKLQRKYRLNSILPLRLLLPLSCIELMLLPL